MVIKKPLKTAAWAGIIAFIAIIVFSIISQVLYSYGLEKSPIIAIISIAYSLVLWVCVILFSYGFIVLGRKYNGRLLVVMSWITIVIAITFIIISIIGTAFAFVADVSAAENPIKLGEENSEYLIPPMEGQNPMDPGLQEFYDEYGISPQLLLIFIILGWIFFSVIVGAYSILIGIGLLKLKDKVEFARPAGILNIISGATFIILVGWFVGIAAIIIEIILLFKASKKLEK
jgi:hypothetical protein